MEAVEIKVLVNLLNYFFSFRDPEPGGGATSGKSPRVLSHSQGSSLQQLSFNYARKIINLHVGRAEIVCNITVSILD